MNAPYYTDDAVTLHHGDSLDVLRTLPAGSVDCCVTSPPYYGLRDSLCHASAINDRIVEDDYSQGSTHLHWECIPLWWQAVEAKRVSVSDEEPPF